MFGLCRRVRAAMTSTQLLVYRISAMVAVITACNPAPLGRLCINELNKRTRRDTSSKWRFNGPVYAGREIKFDNRSPLAFFNHVPVSNKIVDHSTSTPSLADGRDSELPKVVTGHVVENDTSLDFASSTDGVTDDSALYPVGISTTASETVSDITRRNVSSRPYDMGSQFNTSDVNLYVPTATDDENSLRELNPSMNQSTFPTGSSQAKNMTPFLTDGQRDTTHGSTDYDISASGFAVLLAVLLVTVIAVAVMMFALYFWGVECYRKRYSNRIVNESYNSFGSTTPETIDLN